MKKVLILQCEDEVTEVWNISTKKQEEAGWYKAFKVLDFFDVFLDIREAPKDNKAREKDVEFITAAIRNADREVGKKIRPYVLSLLQVELNKLQHHCILDTYNEYEANEIIVLYNKAKKKDGKAAKQLIKSWLSEGFDRWMWEDLYLSVKKVK